LYPTLYRTLRRKLTFLTGVALAACLASAQEPAKPPTGTVASGIAAAAPANDVVCPLSVGTAFNASLLESIDTRRNKAGDKFRAETTETVRYGRSVVFPKGTIIEGHIVRSSTAAHGKDRVALFLEFDRAILKNGQSAAMNAGIQAIAVGPNAAAKFAPAAGGEDLEEAPWRTQGPPSDRALPLDTNLNADGSMKNLVAVSRETDDLNGVMIRPPAMELPLTQGAFTKGGLLTSDSKGALGAPEIKIYTPLSAGSDGTVLLSSKRNVRLERGTRLLVVIQPPPGTDTVLR
jgi:hypothetical protein